MKKKSLPLLSFASLFLISANAMADSATPQADQIFKPQMILTSCEKTAPSGYVWTSSKVTAQCPDLTYVFESHFDKPAGTSLFFCVGGGPVPDGWFIVDNVYGRHCTGEVQTNHIIYRQFH